MSKVQEQWLRAAILGANDGLVSISSLMMGIVAAQVSRLVVITTIAGILAGSLSMAVGEYVSVRAQGGFKESTEAALASSISFATGGLIPFVGAFLPNKLLSIIILTLIGLLFSGIISAKYIQSEKKHHIFRVVLGGILGMVVTSGIGYLLKNYNH